MANKLLANPPAQSAQRTSHLVEPKCKWGRHCCRPHSHPRVAFIRRTWRPVFRHFRGKPQIRFLHRRSRRHPVLSSSVSSPKTVFFPFKFRDRSFHVGQVPQAVLLLPKLQHSHRYPAGLSGPFQQYFRVPIIGQPSVWSNPSARRPTGPRGQLPKRQSGSKFHPISSR